VCAAALGKILHSMHSQEWKFETATAHAVTQDDCSLFEGQRVWACSQIADALCCASTAPSDLQEQRDSLEYCDEGLPLHAWRMNRSPIISLCSAATA